MPEHAGSGHGPELPAHVKDYFRRRGLDPDKLPPRTRSRLAALSAAEVKVLDDVGASLEEDGADEKMYVFVIH